MVLELRLVGSSSSCEEEVCAAVSALDWITAHEHRSYNKIVLATDSKSLCCALQSSNEDIRNLINKFWIFV